MKVYTLNLPVKKIFLVYLYVAISSYIFDLSFYFRFLFIEPGRFMSLHTLIFFWLMETIIIIGIVFRESIAALAFFVFQFISFFISRKKNLDNFNIADIVIQLFYYLSCILGIHVTYRYNNGDEKLSLSLGIVVFTLIISLLLTFGSNLLIR